MTTQEEIAVLEEQFRSDDYIVDLRASMPEPEFFGLIRQKGVRWHELTGNEAVPITRIQEKVIRAWITGFEASA